MAPKFNAPIEVAVDDLLLDEKNPRIPPEKQSLLVASTEGLKALRQDRNLEEALIAAGGIRARLISRLVNAGRNLRAAKDDLPRYKKDKEVQGLIADVEEALQDLEKIK